VEKDGKKEFNEVQLCCRKEPYWYASWFKVVWDRYKLLILEKTKLSLFKSAEILLLEIFDNRLILLNAVESLEIEFPILEKSIELIAEFLSLGDRRTDAGVLSCPVLFFFW
jgi:hypothetical protein